MAAARGRAPPSRIAWNWPDALRGFVGACPAAPLMLGWDVSGFLLILVDDHRRGLQDRLARTVVVYASDAPRLS